MQLVYTKSLRPGMILARHIYDNRGRLLLKNGLKLDTRLIHLIKKQNIPFLYIHTELTKNIEIKPLISQKIHTEICDKYSSSITQIVKQIPRTKKSIPERVIFAIQQELIKFLDVTKIKILVEEALDDLLELEEKYRFYYKINYKRTFVDDQIEIMIISLLLGMKNELTRSELIQLGTATLFHDIGVIFSTDYKRETHEQIDEFHTEYGYKFLRESKHISAPEYIPALEHHERMDGSGYPSGKKGIDAPVTKDRVDHLDYIFRYSDIITVANEFYWKSNDESVNFAVQSIFEKRKITFNSYVAIALKSIVNPFPAGFSCILKHKKNEIQIPAIIIENKFPNFRPIFAFEEKKDISESTFHDFEIIMS
jgi:hypothetical protein